MPNMQKQQLLNKLARKTIRARRSKIRNSTKNRSNNQRRIRNKSEIKMELKITTKQEKPLLSRTEIFAEMTFAGATPSTENVKKEIAKQTKTSEELVHIKKISTAFGYQTAKVEAQVYKDAKTMKVMIKQGKKAIEKQQKQKDAAKPAEEKKSE